MKKVSILLSCVLVCSTVWAEEMNIAEVESTHWEAGIDTGRDFGSQENLVAISIASPLGNGYKAIVEYADGRHGDWGSNVLSLKFGKELFALSHVDVGIVAGIAHASALIDNGNGLVAGAEASYPLTEKVAIKVEASRFFGIGQLSYDRANVVQGGIVYKF